MMIWWWEKQTDCCNHQIWMVFALYSWMVRFQVLPIRSGCILSEDSKMMRSNLRLDREVRCWISFNSYGQCKNHVCSMTLGEGSIVMVESCCGPRYARVLAALLVCTTKAYLHQPAMQCQCHSHQAINTNNLINRTSTNPFAAFVLSVLLPCRC